MSSPSDNLPVPPTSADPSREEMAESRIVLEGGLIDRYLAGTLRPEETERAKELFSDPRRAHLLGWLKEWAERDADAQPPRASQTLEQLWRQVRDKEALDQTQRGRMGGLEIRTPRKWGWVAAIVTTLVVAKLTFHSIPVHDTTPGRTYATGPDQQATVTLDDGTRVTLAPRTTLRTVNDGATRTVILKGETGEAYFEVPQSSGRAFQVRSGQFTTRVLGTVFMVKHPVGSSRIRVAVAEGKVSVASVSQRHPDVTLTAGAIGEVDDSIVQVNTVNELAPKNEWLRGRLVFRDMSVATVLQTLGHWYGYQFRCADSTLALQTVTIGVNMRSSSAALATLEEVLRVRLTVVGDTVTLTPQTTRKEKSGSRVRSYDVWTPPREVGR